MSRKYLTKSLFKTACECPTKLYYHLRPEEYGNNRRDDAFLAALAEGGFQVGELAKLRFPGGVEVHTLEVDEALRETDELLRRDEVTIFEAAIRFGDCLARVDILRKRAARSSSSR